MPGANAWNRQSGSPALAQTVWNLASFDKNSEIDLIIPRDTIMEVKKGQCKWGGAIRFHRGFRRSFSGEVESGFSWPIRSQVCSIDITPGLHDVNSMGFVDVNASPQVCITMCHYLPPAICAPQLHSSSLLI